jgi:hypothetical protein
VLEAFQPFLRNINPMVDQVGKSKGEVTGFLANTVAATEAFDIGAETNPDNGALLGTDSSVRYLRLAQILGPESLSYYPRPLGTSRMNPYGRPGALGDDLKNGGSIFGTGPCPVGNVAIPATADPETLAPLIQDYAFRTTDQNAVAAPACKVQGTYPGYGTSFPQLRAEPASTPAGG